MSLSDTGVVVLDQLGNTIAQQSIKTKPDMPDLNRVVFIAEKVLDIIRPLHLDHRTRVFIEPIPTSGRPTGKSYTRHEIVGIIKYFLYKEGIEAYLIPAKTLKKEFTGSGNASKTDMRNGVYNRFKRLVTNDNIADAYALAGIGIDFIEKRKRFSIERLTRA